MTNIKKHGNPQWMHKAIELAKLGLYTTKTNPRVGCVLVNNNQIIASGFHKLDGEQHAERNLFNSIKSIPNTAELYLTLEPCCHFGKQPPCLDLLLKLPIKTIFIAMADPNPLVGGKSIGLLKKAGFNVEVGMLAQQASELNIGFINRFKNGNPWVRAKIAITIDGYIAATDNSSKWITQIPARLDGHKFRARSQAILTTYKTINIDKPNLNVRGIENVTQPDVYILDSEFKTSLQANVFQYKKQRNVFRLGIKTRKNKSQTDIKMPEINNKVSLGETLKYLGSQGVNELHIEAGSGLITHLHNLNLIDEYVIYQADSLLGGGVNFISIPNTKMANLKQMKCIERRMVGKDLRTILRKS